MPPYFSIPPTNSNARIVEVINGAVEAMKRPLVLKLVQARAELDQRSGTLMAAHSFSGLLVGRAKDDARHDERQQDA